METLVFPMGVANAGTIARNLMEHRLDPATPAAMIQTVYWAEERAVTAALETIEAEAERAGVKPPATLV